MASINLGRVGFVLRGTWSSGTTYNPLDVVLYNGTSYAAKTTSTGLAPSAASAAWQELTQVSSAVSSGIANSAVRYDTGQKLSGAQQTTARANIDAASNASVSNIQTTVNGLSSRVNIAEGHVETLSSRLNTDEGNISSLQTRMTSAESGIAANGASISALQTRMTSAESAIANKITISGTTLVVA